MAAPVISSITVVPDPVLPGGTTVVTINATDPDSTAVTLVGTATDAAGAATPQNVVITIQDVLTYALTGAPVGWTVTQRGAPNTHIFDVTVP